MPKSAFKHTDEIVARASHAKVEYEDAEDGESVELETRARE